ncbi:MAG: hypothetical protein RIM99_04535 [Cyclobacteriaceae bacterium]
MRRNSFFILFQLWSISVYCQTSFREAHEFLLHLKGIESYEEGVFSASESLKRFSSQGQQDTLLYYKGLFEYSLKQPEQSIRSFSDLGNSNEMFRLHASFLSSFQSAYLETYIESKKLLDEIEAGDPFYKELVVHEQAGLSLLDRDFESFEKYSNQFSGSYYQLSSFQNQLIKNRDGLLKMKRKSPLIAGLMSGLIPGSGKAYTGKAGEGYTTLLFSSILALQAREGYKEDGASSLRFKIFAGLFSALYVANIWGSVLSVKVYKDDFNATFDEAILLNMHVPLRTIFN